MPPPGSSVMKIPHVKGGHPHYPDPTEETETITHEPMTTTMTTIKEMVTTMMNSISSTVETMIPGGADSNTSSMIPAEDGGANEMTNSTNTDIAKMNNISFSGEGTGGIITSTGTSFEQVTTEITTTLMDGMHMEHVDDSDDYNAVLFIVLGVVLGILIIVAVVLGVIYNHYRKRGFTEISDHGQVDPQSMKQLQQASSQDALLDK